MIRLLFHKKFEDIYKELTACFGNMQVTNPSFLCKDEAHLILNRKYLCGSEVRQQIVTFRTFLKHIFFGMCMTSYALIKSL